MKDKVKMTATVNAARTVVSALIEFLQRATGVGATAKEQELIPEVADALCRYLMSGMLDANGERA